jgi:hypothetical protein
LAILHTWRRDLGIHPHVHVLATMAAGTPDSRPGWTPGATAPPTPPLPAPSRRASGGVPAAPAPSATAGLCLRRPRRRAARSLLHALHD